MAKQPAYTIELTGDQFSHLSWSVNHGYFPADLYKALKAVEGEENVYGLQEHEAWELVEWKPEEGYDLLACCGDSDLISKVLELQSSIL